MIDTSRGINWVPATFLIIYQALIITALPFYLYYGSPTWTMVGVSVLLLYITGISITAGYHRFYSHRAYKTNKWVEGVLLFFGSMSAQGSALRWSYDHRIHHAHVDTDDDPYSIQKGFWYAHCLWILEKPRTIDSKVVPDLLKNPMVTFQHRYYGLTMVLSNIIGFLFVGWLFNDYLGAFVLSLWTRMFFLHHFTWFINSLAHTWGDKPFCQEQSAVDNYLISLLTFGEGYHNYHHTFANDYRNGIRWYHFDPTKWVIWTLNKLGLATGLKRMDPYAIQKRMVMERKDLLMDRVRELWYVKRDELEVRINELSDQMVEKMNEFRKLKEEYLLSKKNRNEPDLVKNLKLELKNLKRSLKHDWKVWSRLSKTILHMRTLPV